MGAHILRSGSETPPCTSIGRITSSSVSETLDRSVALALLANGRARVGDDVCAYFGGHRHWAKVVTLPFYDGVGARLDV